jgi:hypothetical protein
VERVEAERREEQAKEKLKAATDLRLKLEAMSDDEYAKNVRSPTKGEMLKKLDIDIKKLRKKLGLRGVL